MQFGTPVWLIPETGFDEGIDLDSVLPAIQIVIAAVSIISLERLRQEKHDEAGFLSMEMKDERDG